MTHQNLAYHRHFFLDFEWRETVEIRRQLSVDRIEDFGDGIDAKSPFAKNVLVARPGLEFDDSDAGGFLTAVMLFFHQQVETVECPGIGPVFLFIVLDRLA